MKTTIYSIVLTICTITFMSCGIYSFTGGNTGDAKTIKIDFFSNRAPLIEPGIDQKFTQELRDLFTRQTNLTLSSTKGDMQFEGEITGYRINPMSATANQRAVKNRLTITINVIFTNKLNEKDDFEKKFTHFADYEASQQLTGSVLENSLKTIFDRITQDIFAASVGKW